MWAAVQATSLGFVPSLIGTQPISAAIEKLGVADNARGANAHWQLELSWLRARARAPAFLGPGLGGYPVPRNEADMDTWF